MTDHTVGLTGAERAIAKVAMKLLTIRKQRENTVNQDKAARPNAPAVSFRCGH